MEILATLAAALLAAPLAAQPAGSLPGVSDEETAIPSGQITRFHRGNGDVVFVLDRAGHWYRLGLNEGCLKATPNIHSLAFANAVSGQRVDRFTNVVIDGHQGSLQLTCRIESIRRSAAPPQVDSKSPVTLD